MTEHHLDLRGLKCPLPALRTRAALASLPAGDVLIVECTDPLAAIDVPNAAREGGADIVSQARAGRVLTFGIRKADVTP